MVSKSRKKSNGSTLKREVLGNKGTGKLIEEIIRESLNPDCNLILLESNIRELENSDKNYAPVLLRMVSQGGAKEQKIILDLLVRKKNAEIIKGIRTIAQEDTVCIKIRRQALAQLSKWGEPVDEGLQKLLNEGEGLFFAIEKYAEFEEALGPEVEASFIQRFTQLPRDLRISIITQLLEDYAYGLSIALKLLQKEADWDERIVRLLADRGTKEVGDLFCKIFVETKNKNLRRLFKKYLFQMKNRGLEVAIPTIEEGESVKFQKIESPQPNAYVTSIDYLGDRLAFLSKSVFGWGMVLFQITLNDQEGIKNFSVFSLNRREIKNLLNRISQNSIIQLIEIDPAYCHFLIEEAYQVNIKKGITPPEQFVHWKAEIDDMKREVTEPIVYSRLSKETVQKEKSEIWRAKYLRIHDLDLFKDWFLEPRFVWEYVEKYQEAENSPLVLNAYQMEERKESIILEASRSVFNDEYRGLYRRRLEEMAYVLFYTNQEESARLVLFAADDLGPDGLPSERHGFLKGLVQKSILFYAEDVKDRRGDKFIITPR